MWKRTLHQTLALSSISLCLRPGKPPCYLHFGSFDHVYLSNLPLRRFRRADFHCCLALFTRRARSSCFWFDCQHYMILFARTWIVRILKGSARTCVETCSQSAIYYYLYETWDRVSLTANTDFDYQSSLSVSFVLFVLFSFFLTYSFYFLLFFFFYSTFFFSFFHSFFLFLFFFFWLINFCQLFGLAVILTYLRSCDHNKRKKKRKKKWRER